MHRAEGGGIEGLHTPEFDGRDHRLPAFVDADGE